VNDIGIIRVAVPSNWSQDKADKFQADVRRLIDIVDRDADPVFGSAQPTRIVPAGLAIKIMEALHVPQYEGLTIKGEPLRLVLQHRIENLLEVAALIPDADATWRLRLRLDSILAIMADKEKDGLDIGIRSTAFKSIRHWADWRADK
jgi:hypothetical protein